ncbi:VOC family protein [Conexibacter sp. SYSU D00693]|uniref:VOC family protein n=1 Tax=Conexibacter sp. SYSU D00693 TaxID=2812560 RepID=UPI00196AB4F4|nr:VOC family protein [Conexibacter sp. SYSU D00693]
MPITRNVCLDHLNLHVSDMERSRAFYRAAVAPLGFTELVHEEWVLFGPEGAQDLCLVPHADPQPVHVALAAASRLEVDAFHAAALAAGGTDNGAPGLRPQYHAGYYGAFVLDPDGHNLEAVFHER